MDALLTNDVHPAVTFIVAIVLMSLLAIAALAFMLMTIPLPYLAVSLPVFVLGLAIFHHRYGYWPGLKWWRLWAVIASAGVAIGPRVPYTPTPLGSEITIMFGCFAIVECVLWLVERTGLRFGPGKRRKTGDRPPNAPVAPTVSEEPEKPVFGRRSSPPPATYRNSR